MLSAPRLDRRGRLLLRFGDDAKTDRLPEAGPNVVSDPRDPIFHSRGRTPKARLNNVLKCWEELNPNCKAAIVISKDGWRSASRAASRRKPTW